MENEKMTRTWLGGYRLGEEGLYTTPTFFYKKSANLKLVEMLKEREREKRVLL